MRNASEITFGIEIESIVPRNTINIGSYHSPYHAQGLPEGWTTKTDCSIHAPTGYRGCEFVSPVLQGADGLRQIVAVCEQLKAWGVKVNHSTGLHVHVGFDRNDTRSLRNLMHLTSHHEQAIYATTGTPARERDRWCKSIKDSFQHVAKNPTLRNMRADGCRSAADRYHILNVSNLLGRTRPTVEFRAFAGTTNATKIVGYVRLCVGLVQKAESMARRTNWHAKNNVATSPIARKSGAGATALTRLFYALGWTKGREARTFGAIETDAAPDLPTVKKEFARLARKYDRAKAVA